MLDIFLVIGINHFFAATRAFVVFAVIQTFFANSLLSAVFFNFPAAQSAFYVVNVFLFFETFWEKLKGFGVLREHFAAIQKVKVIFELSKPFCRAVTILFSVMAAVVAESFVKSFLDFVR